MKLKHIRDGHIVRVKMINILKKNDVQQSSQLEL